jgi:hypothetical protein
MANGQTRGQELWVKDLQSEKVERALPGYAMQDYAVSGDGKEIAFVMNDQSGRTNLWVAPTSRRSSPVRIYSADVEDSPFFLPDGDLIFRSIEGGSNFLYRMKTDGTGRRKITPERILDVHAVSPDGRWIIAGAPNTQEDGGAMSKAFAVDGSTSVPLCLGYCFLNWDTTGRFVYLFFPSRYKGSYLIPVVQGLGLPKTPPGGILHARKQIPRLLGMWSQR